MLFNKAKRLHSWLLNLSFTIAIKLSGQLLELFDQCSNIEGRQQKQSMYLFVALCMPMTMGMIPWVAPSLHNCGDTLHKPDNRLFVHAETSRKT